MELTSPADEIIEGVHATLRPLRLIRVPDVIARVGIKRSMIYKLMAQRRFPNSRSLGPKCAVWVEAEIDAWISELINTRFKSTQVPKAGK